MLKDCPINTAGIKNARKIFGPDLATIRGKTVQHKPTPMITDYVDIPWGVVEANQRVTLATDIMYVC